MQVDSVAEMVRSTFCFLSAAMNIRLLTNVEGLVVFVFAMTT